MIRHGISGLADHLARFVRRKSCSAFFVTGTDTGVGKTWVACGLIREFRRRNMPAGGFKPICCGDRADACELWKCADREIPLDIVNPIHLPKPLAPVSQACPSWKSLLRSTLQAFGHLAACDIRPIVVEGAGGLLCPITDKKTMRELAGALRLPVVIVAQNRLGVLNHVLLTVEAASASGLECVAIALNSYDPGRPDGSGRPHRVAPTGLGGARGGDPDGPGRPHRVAPTERDPSTATNAKALEELTRIPVFTF